MRGTALCCTVLAAMGVAIAVGPVDRVDVDEHPVGRFIPSDPTGRTPVDGVWAAGNARDTMAMVMASAASGTTAGVAVNADLIAEEVAAARATEAVSE